MRLILFHPGAAIIDCDDCKNFIYDIETGQRKMYRAGPDREERPQTRPKGVPTPCGDCPRADDKGPRDSTDARLSVRTWRSLELYLRVRASQGAFLRDEMRTDLLLMQNMTIVDGVYRQFEQHQQAIELSSQLLPLLSK